MSEPKRIQRKRTRGWRMPEDAVYVGRPTRWGNPFGHVEQYRGVADAVALYANTARGIWDPTKVRDWPDWAKVYEKHQAWLRHIGGHPVEVARTELAGRDLVCWCPLDQPCHGDVLLEIANAGEGL